MTAHIARTPYARLAALLIAGLSAAPSLLAQSHPTEEMLEQYRRDGSLAQRTAFMKRLGNHRIDANLIKNAEYRLMKQYRMQQGATDEELRAMTPPPAWQGMPTTGNVKIFTLCIDFSDYPASTTKAEVESMVFGTGNTNFPYESLKSYYTRSSYGKLNLQGSILGWYRPSYPRSQVPQTDAGREKLIKEALASFDQQGHDFSQYDNNNDGVIDYLAVIWTGPHNGWGNFWWGYQTSWSNSTDKFDGKKIGKYSWQWENYQGSGKYEPSTLIHETGHALGLPDYYDYDANQGPDGGVGGMDMMDATLGDHNAFSKMILDWLTPTVVTSAQSNVTLKASSEEPAAIIMMPNPPSNGFGEYFMIDYRRRVKNDTKLPNEGLVVWHVDSTLKNGDYLFDNSYTAHKLLRLMEADGLEEIEQSKRANAGDFYVNGKVFGPTTSPNSKRYNGTATNMGVSNIGIVNGTATFNIDGASSGDTQAPTASGSVNGTSGTLTLNATAQDNVGVTKVEFYVDNALKGTDTTSPYSLSLDSTTLANGSHALVVKAYDAAGNVGTSTSVSFNVQNGTSSSLIKNGGFESGSTSWSGSTARIGAWGTSQPAYAGTYCAWLGAQGKTATQTLSQNFTIASTATKATLSFALKITTAETENVAYDTLKVQLVDPATRRAIKTLATYSNVNKGTAYAMRSFDLTAYKGRQVQLLFTMNEDASLKTHFAIDEVAVSVQGK